MKQEPAPSQLDPSMLEIIEARAVKAFGLGTQWIEPGEVVTVSRSRAEYLRFLGIGELV